MTPVTDPAILAQLDAQSGKPVTDPAILAQLNGGSLQQGAAGPQPTTMDKIIGSPVGRFAHDAVAEPLAAIADLLTKYQTLGTHIPVDRNHTLSAALDRPYQAALAANRNTPGYAAARAEADKAAAAKGSGLSDQLLASFMPALAGVTGGLLGGSLDQANASADAQTAAQQAYAKANPVKSTVAQLAGGLLAGPEMAKLPAKLPVQPPQIAPSIADLKNAARQSYDAADKSGVIVSAPSYDSLVSGVQTKLADEGIDKTLHPNALAAYKRLEDAKGSPMTLKGMETMRRVAGDAVSASATNPADKRLGYIIQNAIDDHMAALTPADVLPGSGDPATAINSLNSARDYWGRAAQADIIQKQIDKAGIKASANYSQSGVENALRQQFKTLALNDRVMGRLSPPVQQAVKDVAMGSPAGNLMRFAGKFAPHGPIATGAGMGVGYMLGGVGGAAEGGLASIAIPALGELARVGATKSTMAAAQRALDAAALGKTALPRFPTAPLQLPSITRQSRVPYGLLGSAAALQSRQ